MNLEIDNFERELLENDLLSDNNEGEVTVQNLIEMLENAWLNEKFSPEILPHKIEVVDLMFVHIKYMESNISQLPKTDIIVDIHKIELERMRYIITSYLRCRLKKIERCAFYILEQESTRESEERYLSESEYKFAREYVQHLDNHFEVLLKEMPFTSRTLENSNKRIKPDIDSYVFLRANKLVENVIIKDVFDNKDEQVELRENSLHVLPYSSVSNIVKDCSVQLI